MPSLQHENTWYWVLSKTFKTQIPETLGQSYTTLKQISWSAVSCCLMLPHGFITLMHPWKLGGVRLPSFAASVLHHAGVIQPKAFWHDQLDCHQTGLRHTNETYIWLASQWTGMETGFYAKQASKPVILPWVERKHPVACPTRRKEHKVSANQCRTFCYVDCDLVGRLLARTKYFAQADCWCLVEHIESWQNHDYIYILNCLHTSQNRQAIYVWWHSRRVFSQRAFTRLDFANSHWPTETTLLVNWIVFHP